jgi:hypothetical protein
MNLMRTVAVSPLVLRLGYGLVHFLWEGVLIAAVLGLALLMLRGRPAARHAAAWLALAAMAAAVPLTAWLVPARPAAAPLALAGFAPDGRRASLALADVGRLARGRPGVGHLDPTESTGPATPVVGRNAPLSGHMPPAGVSAQTEPVGETDAGTSGSSIGPWMPGVVVA